MRRFSCLTRGLVVVLISAQLSGCTQWHAEDLSPAAVVERQQPTRVRVRLADGSYEHLYAPEIRGDSLLGRRDPHAKQPDRALRLSDVKVVATANVSEATTALVWGVAIVGAIVAVRNIHLNFGGLFKSGWAVSE